MGVRIEATRYKRQPDYWTFDVIEDGEVICSVRAACPTDPRGREVAERILAAINGDTVPAPTLPDDVGELVRLLRAAPHVVPKSRILAAADALEALGGQAAAPTLATVTCPEGTCDGCPDPSACAALRPDDLPDLTFSEWVELLEDVEKGLRCDDERTEHTEVDRVRVGQRMKWAPMLGYEVIDHESGVVLILMSDGSVRWADGSVPGEPS